ncbi:hypothetical protein [Cochlodiniinecator piscidefendens]|uniref:hypothetical protein n=1 Tax=Cochlodiniinecator piscidefendens TaxID=2715756 RepID=UPI00140E7F10|nr:hypothetical protein [Cochlodiniinecator piscidefendens]
MIAALRLLPFVASGLLVAALWWVWSDRASLQADNAALTRELSVQTQIAAQMQEARAVAQAHAARVQSKATEFDTLRETILRGEDDADLPDWFTDHLDRLFSAPN